jgi:NAD(P)-dependent dehydrogenase (short-subunit alcohol dehydrogenase family)
MGRSLDRLLDWTLLGYTKWGYRFRGLEDEPVAGSLDGCNAVVTGATSGLGHATALGLAGLGARVVLVGRSEERAEATRQAIRRRHPHARVDVELADVSLMREVRDLAERIEGRIGPVHRLVHNAGVLLDEREETDEGIERTLATNLVGPFLLTRLLLPAMRAAPAARIVFVSSGGMHAEPLRPDDLDFTEEPFDGVRAYARTKRGQVVLAEMLAEELRDQRIAVHAMHPGWADTPGVESSLPRFHKLTRGWLRSPEEGADTIIWLCAAEEPGRCTGLFWHDRRPRPTHRFRQKPASAEERRHFWEALAQRAGCHGHELDKRGQGQLSAGQ